MDICEFNSLVNRYHDNELPPAQRQEVEAHLRACGSCSADLKQMQAFSLALRSATFPKASDAFIGRLESLAGKMENTTVLRFALRMTAAAAAILVAATCYWSVLRTPAVVTSTHAPVVLLPDERVVVDPDSAIASAADDSTAGDLRLDDLMIAGLSKGRP